MGLLIEQERRAWKRQPQTRQRLNPASPYFAGLLFHAPLHPGWGMLDLVSGAPCTKTGLGTSAATPAGVMLVFGAGSYADFTAPAGFDGSLPFSIAWVQRPMSPAAYSAVLDVRPPVNAAYSFLIYQSASDASYQFVVGPRDGGGTGKQAQFATGTQTSGQLDVYVLVAPSGLATASAAYVLYRNGVRQAAAVASPAFGAASPTGMRVGGVLGSPGDPFEGGLVGVTIWQRALDDRAASAWLPEKLYSPRRTRRYIPTTGSGPTSYSLTLTASTTAVAAIFKAAKLQRQASASATAAIRKAAASSKAATTTTTGQVKRAVSLTRSASTALSATVASIKAKLLTLTATVSSSASVKRAVSITRTGTATASATVLRAVSVVRSATAAAAASVVKRTSSTKSATATASAAVSSLKAKLLTLVATVSTSASITKSVRITRAALSSVAALISRLFTPGSGGPPVFIPALRRLISASRALLFHSPDRSVDLESPDRSNTLTSPKRDDT